MRRSFLILTAFGISGLSQAAAPQQGQLPPTVKVEMPPTNAPNPWIHFAELIVPGIIGAGLALLGVLLTTKHNDKTNAANRQHQLEVEVAKAKIVAEYRSRDNRWVFRKDVYVNLLNSITDCILVLAQLNDLQVLFPAKLERPDADLQKRLEDNRAKFVSASVTFVRYSDLAPLASFLRKRPVAVKLFERHRQLQCR
jgi:hypothetical protein